MLPVDFSCWTRGDERALSQLLLSQSLPISFFNIFSIQKITLLEKSIVTSLLFLLLSSALSQPLVSYSPFPLHLSATISHTLVFPGVCRSLYYIYRISLYFQILSLSLSLFLYYFLSFTPNHPPSIKIDLQSFLSMSPNLYILPLLFPVSLSLAPSPEFIKSIYLFVSRSQSSCTLASLFNFSSQCLISCCFLSPISSHPSMLLHFPNLFPLSQPQSFPIPLLPRLFPGLSLSRCLSLTCTENDHWLSVSLTL